NTSGTYDGYREYIAQRIKEPLQAGKEYCISFWANFADADYYYQGCNALGLILSKDSIYADSIYYFNGTWWLWSCNNIYGTPIIGDSTKIIDDTLNWVKIEGRYIAKGGEEFLAIGNFYTNSQTRFAKTTVNGFGISGYFIDMVELFLCEDTVQKPTEPPPASDSSLHYKVPNVISPNGDGLNDAFILESRGIKEVDVKVYNRWGELVQSTKYNVQSPDVLSKTTLWDATHRGQPALQGVYYYLIELSTKNGEVIIEKGTVTVL
ncbi:MAG: gliding motility-associated C-terminal domain-containing protein, partial [Bacteroidia bacterium]